MRTIICGKAGCGKSNLVELLVEKGGKPSISYTTRPPRKGEIDGKDYYFLSDENFEMYIDDGIFYEYIKFNGWGYGTSYDSFENDDIFIMTPIGISKLREEDRKESLIIFIDLSDDVLKERIGIRGDMKGDSLERRFLADKKDFENFTDYDIRITNEDFNQMFYNKKLDKTN